MPNIRSETFEKFCMRQIFELRMAVFKEAGIPDVDPSLTRHRSLPSENEKITKVVNPTRVRLKDLAADRIANFCQEHSIFRDWLVQQILDAPNDGLIVSLATLINASPESKDVDRIMKVAKIAHWKHTRYRIVLALVRIIRA